MSGRSEEEVLRLPEECSAHMTISGEVIVPVNMLMAQDLLRRGNESGRALGIGGNATVKERI